jgi:hypothetical protein
VTRNTGRLVQLGRCGPPAARTPMYFATIRREGEHRVQVSFYGATPAEAVGKAAEWAREGAGT